MATKQPLTNVQKNVQRALDAATSTTIAYAAPEVPPLNNLTLDGLTEELGYINLARKALEKTEKIIKERWKTLADGASEHRSPNFTVKIENRERTALNQGKAKAFFEAEGTLPEYMDTTSVPTMMVKENG